MGRTPPLHYGVSQSRSEGGTKVYILTVTSNDVALTNLISDVEATLADHETRITALETP